MLGWLRAVPCRAASLELAGFLLRSYSVPTINPIFGFIIGTYKKVGSSRSM